MSLLSRKIGVPALDGLRMYPRSAAIIALVIASALTVGLPVAWLTRWEGGSATPALQLQSIAPTGDAGPNYHPASTIEQKALLSFFQLLGGLAVVATVVALFAALGLAASRASQRAGELTVRQAVGAGRLLLYGALLLEAGLIAGTALGLGTTGASGLSRLAILGWWDGTGSGTGQVAAVAALITGLFLIWGLLLPVIFAKRQALGEPSTRPVPLLLPTTQLGLSLVVLVTGGLLARHATRLLHSNQTTAHEGAVYALAPSATSKADLSRGYRDLLDRITSPAGVSLASPGTVLGAGPTNRITTDCGHCMDGTIPAPFKRVTVTQQIVSADSFHALGVGVIAGRVFGPQDSLGAAQVVVVSETLARYYFQYGEPIGRQLRIQDAPGVNRKAADEWYQVIGVVADRRSEAMGGALQPVRAIYLSVLQRPPRSAELLIRDGAGASDPAQVEDALRASLGAGGALPNRSSAGALLARETQRMSWFGLRIGLLGVVMLLIAMVGTAALMRSWVLSLRPELGLRRAVGATTPELLRLVLGRAALVGLVGTGFGIWFGPGIWDSLGETVSGIDTWDPQLIAGLTALLLLSTVAGTVFPAIRAVRDGAAQLLASADE